MDSSYRASGRSGNGSERQERPASSPCPSSSSSSSQASSSSSASSASSSSDSSASSNSSNDSDDEPPPPANNSNGGRGGGNGKKKEEDDGNSSDSSSSDSSADESDLEEDDGVMLDTDDEKDKIKALSTKHDGVPPTDEDEVDSDGSSDLESAYPRLPSAPVDALIAFRRQAAHEELQLSDDLKKQVVADAKQRQQVRREQAQRARKKKKAPQSHKRRHSKQEEYATNGHSTNGSAGTANLKMSPQIITEDEWMVDCSCGLREKNYDDGTSMIQCDSCSNWVHAKCADKLPEAVAQEKFLCFRCSWIFDCVCAIRRRPNHDDGQRMVECESCKTWQHTLCVGIPMTEEPPDDYRCPRCAKKTRRRNSATIASPSRQRQRKRRHTEPSLHHRKNSDASPVVAVNIRSQAHPVSAQATTAASNETRSSRSRQSSEKKDLATPVPSPPPVPAASPPSTPPPPPSTPPPSAALVPGLTKNNRGHLKRQSERPGERSSPSNSSPHRKRGRPLGSSSSSTEKTETHLAADDLDHPSTAPSSVTPQSRGKGLMLRGFSASPSGSNAHSSSSVRPQLPSTPSSGGATSSGHSQSSPSNQGRGPGRKRKGSSARDRLAKKLKIRKSSLR